MLEKLPADLRVERLSDYDRQTLEYLAASGIGASLLRRVRALMEDAR